MRKPDGVETPRGLVRHVWGSDSGLTGDHGSLRQLKLENLLQRGATIAGKEPVSSGTGVRSCAFEPRRAQHAFG